MKVSSAEPYCLTDSVHPISGLDWVILEISEALSSRFVDGVSIVDEFSDCLADFSLICTEHVDLALNTKLIPGRNARLSVLALTYQEGQSWVGSFDSLVIVSHEGPAHRLQTSVRLWCVSMGESTYLMPALVALVWHMMKRNSFTPLDKIFAVAILIIFY